MMSNVDLVIGSDPEFIFIDSNGNKNNADEVLVELHDLNNVDKNDSKLTYAIEHIIEENTFDGWLFNHYDMRTIMITDRNFFSFDNEYYYNSASQYDKFFVLNEFIINNPDVSEDIMESFTKYKRNESKQYIEKLTNIIANLNDELAKLNVKKQEFENSIEIIEHIKYTRKKLNDYIKKMNKYNQDKFKIIKELYSFIVSNYDSEITSYISDNLDFSIKQTEFNIRYPHYKMLRDELENEYTCYIISEATYYANEYDDYDRNFLLHAEIGCDSEYTTGEIRPIQHNSPSEHYGNILMIIKKLDTMLTNSSNYSDNSIISCAEIHNSILGGHIHFSWKYELTKNIPKYELQNGLSNFLSDTAGVVSTLLLNDNTNSCEKRLRRYGFYGDFNDMNQNTYFNNWIEWRTPHTWLYHPKITSSFLSLAYVCAYEYLSNINKYNHISNLLSQYSISIIDECMNYSDKLGKRDINGVNDLTSAYKIISDRLPEYVYDYVDDIQTLITGFELYEEYKKEIKCIFSSIKTNQMVSCTNNILENWRPYYDKVKIVYRNSKNK